MNIKTILSLGLSAAAMTTVFTMWCHTTQYLKDFSNSLQLQHDIIYHDALIRSARTEEGNITDEGVLVTSVSGASTVEEKISSAMDDHERQPGQAVYAGVSEVEEEEEVQQEQKPRSGMEEEKVKESTDVVKSESKNLAATELEKSSTAPEEIMSFDNINDEEKIFVIHAGPHESFSTSLQHYIFNNNALKDALKSDNFKVPIFHQGEISTKNPKNHATLAHCFLDGKQNVLCPETERENILREFKSFVHSAANDGSNVVVSSEEFIFPSLDIDGLTSILEARKYRPHIVLNYRRFYDWVRSVYDSRNTYKAERAESFPTFQSWLQRKMKPVQSKYTKAVYDHFKDIQAFADVTILNLHDTTHLSNSKKSLQERFFCDYLDRAPQSCEAAKNHEDEVTDDLLETVDWKSFRAHLLLGDHHPIKLLSNGDDVRWKQIKEKFVNANDLPRICLTDDLKNRLLQLSIEFEMALIPEEWYNSDEGLKYLKADFEEKTSSRLCSIDVPAALVSTDWQNFLTALDA